MTDTSGGSVSKDIDLEVLVVEAQPGDYTKIQPIEDIHASGIKFTIEASAFLTIMKNEHGKILGRIVRGKKTEVTGFFGWIQSVFEMATNRLWSQKPQEIGCFLRVNEKHYRGFWISCDPDQGAPALKAFYGKRNAEVYVKPACLKLGKKGPGCLELVPVNKTTQTSIYSVENLLALKFRLDDDHTVLQREACISQYVWAVSNGQESITVPYFFGCFTSRQSLRRFWCLEDPDGLLGFPIMVMDIIPPIPAESSLRLSWCYHPLVCGLRANQKPWRLYLGQEDVQAIKFLEAPFIQAKDLRTLGLDVKRVAYDMGYFIGKVIFQLGIAPCGVKFAIGADSSGRVTIYCYDFGRLILHNSNGEKIARSLLDNDPYYPGPRGENKKKFEAGLMLAAWKTRNLELCSESIAYMNSQP